MVGAAPVDMERLRDFSSGDSESLRELVNLYLDQTGENLELLHRAMKAGHMDEMRRLAHASAGASATCGMRSIAPWFRELEKTAQEGNVDQVEEPYIQAKEELERIRDFLAPYL